VDVVRKSRNDGLCGLTPQTFGVAQTHPQRKRTIDLMFDGASPIRHLNVDWPNAQPMTLRVFHQYGGHIEAHRLVVQDGAGKRGQVLHFQIGRGIRNQREAGRMRLREPVVEQALLRN
jgi:hypothetical protein